jgi:hypothetical protein
MRTRYLALTGALAAVIVASLVVVLIAGQGSTPVDETWTPPRTPWGEPDLQGIWHDDFATPFERPDRYAGREFLTDEERDALDQRRTSRGGGGGTFRSETGSVLDVAGAYNVEIFAEVRTKAGKRTSQIVDPPDGRIPLLTEEGLKRAVADRRGRTSTEELEGAYGTERMDRADGPEDRGADERCFGSKLPDFSTFPDASGFARIVQSPTVVAIYYEHGQGGGANRIIPVDGSEHLPRHIRNYLGDSRGRWEGDTLVVDVTNFTPKTNLGGSRETLHLIERFTRVDADTLHYEVTMDDATTWTRPWTVLIEMNKHSDKENRIFESTCHEGNYGLTGILASTRAAERAFAEGRGPDPRTLGLHLRAGDARAGYDHGLRATPFTPLRQLREDDRDVR